MQSSGERGERILCVGMCVLDIVHVCAEYPAEDTDRRCLAGYWQRGGNASNNCTVLRQLGATCEFLGMLSDSPAFGFLLDDCRQRGIELGNCPRAAQDPPFSSVLLVRASDTRTIVHANGDFPILRHEHFGRLDLAAYRWIHFEARNPAETRRMLADIHAHNRATAGAAAATPPIRISVELEKLQVANLELAAAAHLVFLGKELAQHLGWQNARDAVHGLRDRLRQLAVEWAAVQPAIVCTWGAQGCGCLDADDAYTQLPAAPPPGEIVDSLGAGDTFCAAVIYALLARGDKLAAAVAFGNRCAAYKLAHRGYDAIAAFAKQQID